MPSLRSSLRSTRKQKFVSFRAVFVLSITTLQVLNATPTRRPHLLLLPSNRCLDFTVHAYFFCPFLQLSSSSFDSIVNGPVRPLILTHNPISDPQGIFVFERWNYRKILPIVRLGLIGPQGWVYRWKDLSVK